MPAGAVEELVTRVECMYTRGPRLSAGSWGALRFDEAVWNPDGWRWVGDFVGREPVIMFCDSWRLRLAFEIEDGRSLVPRIGECYIFEWCLTNRSTDYLLSFDHEDTLLAAGSASARLSQKKARGQP